MSEKFVPPRYTIGAIAAVVIAGWIAVRIVSKPTVVVASTGTAGSESMQTAAPRMSAADEARDTAATLRQVYPVACQAANADWKWVECHDTVIGFANVLRCAEASLAIANVAQQSLPTVSPTSDCGARTAQAAKGMTGAELLVFTDLVVWLKAHASTLTPILASANMTDACAAHQAACAGLPNAGPGFGTPQYEKASWMEMSSIECTKPLFQCDRTADNVCFINKVAARLGVACDPSENNAKDPLTVRATGERLN